VQIIQMQIMCVLASASEIEKEKFAFSSYSDLFLHQTIKNDSKISLFLFEKG
jgi:hypothetical protein